MGLAQWLLWVVELASPEKSWAAEARLEGKLSDPKAVMAALSARVGREPRTPYKESLGESS